MISRRPIFALPLVGLLGALSTPAFAHRAALAETTLTQRQGRVEIVHVFHLDDVQRALFKAGHIENPDLRSLRDRARLALYIDENFDVIRGDQPIELDLIGAEIIGRTAYVYQEYAGELSLDGLSLRADMFRDLIPGQRNRIDIEIKGQTRSVEFSGQDKTKKINA